MKDVWKKPQQSQSSRWVIQSLDGTCDGRIEFNSGGGDRLWMKKDYVKVETQGALTHKRTERGEYVGSYDGPIHLNRRGDRYSFGYSYPGSVMTIIVADEGPRKGGKIATRFENGSCWLKSSPAIEGSLPTRPTGAQYHLTGSVTRQVDYRTEVIESTVSWDLTCDKALLGGTGAVTPMPEPTPTPDEGPEWPPPHPRPTRPPATTPTPDEGPERPPPHPRPTRPPTRTPTATPIKPFSIRGRASHPVWSGYWWPEEGRWGRPNLYSAGGPLDKYDRWTASTTRQWELRFHSSPSADDAGYQGHCDGWSVSSVLYREPKRAVLASRGSSTVRFETGDVKGLLAAVWEGYAWESANTPQQTFAAGGRKTKDDLKAVHFHKLLLAYLRDKRQALVLNLSPTFGDVWNYPCDEFKMNGAPAGKNAWNVSVRLELADDAVLPPFLGRKAYHYDPITYRVTGQNPSDWRDPSLKAEWTGNSVENHPWWVFCPVLNASGAPQAPPGKVQARFHAYASTNFRELVEGLAKVASGQIERWQSGQYKVTPAQ